MVGECGGLLASHLGAPAVIREHSTGRARYADRILSRWREAAISKDIKRLAETLKQTKDLPTADRVRRLAEHIDETMLTIDVPEPSDAEPEGDARNNPRPDQFTDGLR